MISTSHYKDHPDVRLFILENNDLRVVVSEYGAMLKSIVVKSLNRETVCGLNTYAEDVDQSFYLGSIIGRCGNRIAYGQFELNGVTYHVPVNNGFHHLHGGRGGFDKKLFVPRIESNTLILTYRSPDGEEGYPGACVLTLKYRLEGASLVLETEGSCDQDTLFDPTQHTYFNLNADKSPITNHLLQLNSQHMYGIDESGVTHHELLYTPNSLYDFSKPKHISECLNQTHIQLERNRGLDNYFIKQDQSNPTIAVLSVNDLSVTIDTTHPGAHVYSGNYLEPLSKGSKYPFLMRHGGICFETQHIPNSINFDIKHAPILKTNETVYSRTVYHYKKGDYYEN